MSPEESTTKPNAAGAASPKETQSPSLEPVDLPASNTAAPSDQDSANKKISPSSLAKPLLQKTNPAAKSIDRTRPESVQNSLADKPAISGAIQPQPSMPVSMIVRPDGDREPNNLSPFPGELEDSFESALARLQSAHSRASILKRLLHPLRGQNRSSAHQRSGSGDLRRMVAFDGFHDDVFEPKRERDRRYGTVYTVSEESDGFLVRLELPRRMPKSSLRQTWDLPDEMPDYVYTITLADNVLIINAGLPDEARRRVSYISSSFPSQFQTRIDFPVPVDCYKHRLRNKVLEIIVFKKLR